MLASGPYMIDPGGAGTGEEPFPVTCMVSPDMRSAITVVPHDSLERTLVYSGYKLELRVSWIRRQCLAPIGAVVKLIAPPAHSISGSVTSVTSL